MSEVENLTGVGPALDATVTPEPVVETPPVEPVAESESSPETEQPTDDKPKGVQKRLNELTANWREEQRRAQQLEKMLEQALAGTKQEPEPSAQPQPTGGEPKLEQFQTYEDYVSALADFKADQKIQQWEQRERDRQAQIAQTQRQTEFQAKVSTFEAEHPDFREVVENPALRISTEVAQLVVEAGDPSLAYHLGKNPDEAARISALPIHLAALELGRLVAKASAPQTRTQTNAPEPIEPLTGGSGTRVVDEDSLSDAEWVAHRRNQLKR